MDYEDFVTQTRSRMNASYAEVTKALRRSAERNKRYYKIRRRSVGLLLQPKKAGWQADEMDSSTRRSVPCSSNSVGIDC